MRHPASQPCMRALAGWPIACIQPASQPRACIMHEDSGCTQIRSWKAGWSLIYFLKTLPQNSRARYVLCLYTTHMVSTERCLVPVTLLCAAALICTLVTFQNERVDLAAQLAAAQAQIATQHEMNRELLAKQHEI